MQNLWEKIKPFAISTAIALGVGGLSALMTKGNMNIYDELNKPPMMLFPIVWGILFVLMGIGAALVYTRGTDRVQEMRSALWVYGIQLIVNFFWSIIFFNLRTFLFAFIWLLLLWILIVAMIVKFKRISPPAYLQIPYLLWVTFAGYLTLMIYLLNG